ncbi:MAG: CHC2 zinc finger domain-containing protein, partial [Desulfobacterales bacterium]
MTIYIPEDKVSEIKNTADIVEVISEVVVLKKTGKNYVGLCPFHSEKTPSFTVSPEKQIFYCFGCAAGGNVFSFLMKHDGMSFPDAAKMLAGRYGLDIPTPTMSPEQKRRISQRENLFAANRQAMEFFRKKLLDDISGRQAIKYL